MYVIIKVKQEQQQKMRNNVVINLFWNERVTSLTATNHSVDMSYLGLLWKANSFFDRN